MLTVYTVTCRVITTAITKTGKHRARFGANVITLKIPMEQDLMGLPGWTPSSRSFAEPPSQAPR